MEHRDFCFWLLGVLDSRNSNIGHIDYLELIHNKLNKAVLGRETTFRDDAQTAFGLPVKKDVLDNIRFWDSVDEASKRTHELAERLDSKRHDPAEVSKTQGFARSGGLI